MLIIGSEGSKEQLSCPICHEEWIPLKNPKGLVSLCINAVRQRAVKHSAEKVSRLPPEMRARILSKGMALSVLGVSRIRAWIEDTDINTLNLAGFNADSLSALVPSIPMTVTSVILSSVPVSDDQLGGLLSKHGKTLRHLQCDLMQACASESQLEGHSLAHLSAVQSLDVSFHRNLAPSSLVSLLGGCGPHLTSLKLAGCISVGDEVLMAIRACSLLEELDISCTVVTADGFEQVLISCPFLRVLNISDCIKLDGNAVCKACSMSALSLEELMASGLPDLNDVGLSDLLDSPISRHFKVLNLSRNQEITDESARLIPRWCKALRVLDVDMCNGISLKALQRLVVELPRLEVFPLRMIRDTSVKSQLTYILRSRGQESSGDGASVHEPESCALRNFLGQNEGDQSLVDYAKMHAKSASAFCERLRDSIPNYRDPKVVEFYQAPRTRVKTVRLAMFTKTSYSATKKLHAWLDANVHDALEEDVPAEMRHLVAMKPSMGIFRGQTVLHCIVRNNVASLDALLTTVRYLVEHHANPDLVESKTGLSPLLFACYLQLPDSVRAMLEVTQLPERFRRQGTSGLKYENTSTMQVLQQVRRGETISELPERANVTACDRSGLQAIHIAASSGKVITVHTLIQSRVDPNALDTCGRTALWWACRMGHARVVEELMCNELTNPSIPSMPMGGLPESTPLRVAIMCKNQEAADMVRDAINARSWANLQRDILGAQNELAEKPKKACAQWLQNAFGAQASLKSSWGEIVSTDQFGRHVPPRTDRWQLSALLTEEGEEEAAQRGSFVAEELLLPLMRLGEDCALKGTPKALMEYLFQQGVAKYSLPRLLEASERVLATLGSVADDYYTKLQYLPKLHKHAGQKLSNTSDQLINQGASWGGVHQAYAHGPLPWLEKERESSTSAAQALLENGALPNVQEFMEWVASLGSRSLLGLRFWACVYDLWILGEARRANPVAQAKLLEIVEALPSDVKSRVRIHSGPVKKLKRVQQKKVDYGSLDEIVEDQRKTGDHVSEEHIAYLHEVSAGLGTLQDRMAAGGMCDLVRATIECEDEEAALAVIKMALQRRRGDHGLEAVRLKNGFHKDVPPGSYRDVKILFLCQDQDSKHRPFRHLIECQVLLKDFLVLKSSQHAAYRVVRGEFGIPNRAKTGAGQAQDRSSVATVEE
jgi:hypothetical protein